MKIAVTVARAACLLALAGAGQAAAQGSMVPALPRTLIATVPAGPLGYGIQRVLAIQGMGDRNPICAGRGGTFLIVSYIVKNNGAAPQDPGALAHFTLLDPKGQVLTHDRSTAGEISELMPERAPVGPSIGPGGEMETYDVFEMPVDQVGEAGWKIKVAGAGAPMDLPKPVLSPYPPPKVCAD